MGQRMVWKVLRPAKPLAHSWLTRLRSAEFGLGLVQEGPGPPPDISSLQGPE